MAWLRRLAARMASEVELAEDAVQETLLAAVRHGPQVRGNLRAWLRSVLRNALRRRANHDRRLEDREEQWARRAEWKQRSAQDVGERFALQHDLSRAVSALDEELRRVVLLRFLEGRSLKEISQAVGAPISTVDARIQRALDELRWRLERSHGDGEEGRRKFHSVLLLFVAGEEAPRASLASPLAWVAAAAVALLGVAGALRWVGSGSSSSELDSRLEPLVEAPVERPPTIHEQDPLRTPVDSRAERPPSPATLATGSLELRIFDDSDAPIAEAVVALAPEESSLPAPMPRRTNSDGRASWTELPTGSYELRFDRLAPIVVTIRPQETTRATTRFPGPPLRGSVVDELGRPAPGALVWVSASPGGAFWSSGWRRGILRERAVTRVDAQGRFEIPGCGAVRLAGARAAGFAPSWPAEVDLRSKTRGPLELRLDGPGAELAGVVHDSAGHPLPGALLVVDPFEVALTSWPLLATSTDDAGRFRFDSLAPGARPLLVRAPGLADGFVTCDLLPGRTTWREVHLLPGASLRGRVLSDSGRGRPEAIVSWTPADVDELSTALGPCRARATPDGFYALDGVTPGLGLLRAETQEEEVKVESLIALHETRHQDLRFPPRRHLHGRIVDELGRGLPELDLVFPAKLPRDTLRVATDAEGRFEAVLPEEDQLHMRVFEHGWLVLDRELEPVGSEVEWTVPDGNRPSATLRARVDVPGRLLLRRLDGGNHRGKKFRASTDGRLLVTPLPPARFELRWLAPDCERTLTPASVELLPGEELDLGALRVHEPGRVELDLRDPGPSPVHLLVWNEHETLVERRALDAPLGVTRTTLMLAAGVYTLELFSPTRAPHRLAFQVRESGVTKLEARLTPAPTTRIKISDPAGARLRTLAGDLLDAQGERLLRTEIYPRLTDPAGGYSLELGLQPGVYTLVLEEQGVVRARHHFEHDGNAMVRVELPASSD